MERLSYFRGTLGEVDEQGWWGGGGLGLVSLKFIRVQRMVCKFLNPESTIYLIGLTSSLECEQPKRQSTRVDYMQDVNPDETMAVAYV